MRKAIILTALFLPVYAAIAWFTGNLLGLSGSKLWILRGALWLVGAIAAAVVLLFVWNKEKQEKAEQAPEEPAGTDDISLLIRDAEAKLAAAQTDKKLGGLPAVFLIGETGAAKTSTILHSGLDAELLAGHIYQDNNVVPTRAANLWYAKRAVFVEGAGSTVAEAGVWAKIARRLQPSRLGSAVGKNGQAPRAALVLLESESLIRPGASETLAATARTLRARLGEVSQTLGINLPVYALFTKMDRVPFFLEYVRNLTNDEAVQVFGVTLPLAGERTGVYADEEAARLTGAFEQLFRSLANHRPTFLAREHEAAKLPGIYEFPREFRKLRNTGVQFLVDLCRPSQLTTGPFLRGFYFSGVRPVVVNEAAPVPSRPQQKDREAALAATGMFRADMVAQAAAQATPQVVGTKRVPQWVFLSRFFNDLLLGDRVAMGASGSSQKTSLLRRILLASAAALCLFYSIFLIVSFVKNRALETTVADAARGIQAVEAGGVKVASLDSLQRLETLRKSLALLTDYARNGNSPMSYHWGLYTGDELYPQVRRIYFENFRRLLFGETQAKLLDTLRGLPVTGPPPEYGPTYDTLKAYLITTSNHDKSTREFLSPVLSDRWSAGRNVDVDRLQLAQKQFDFYSEELKVENPFSSANDDGAIAQGRKYLNQFAGVERVYAAMLADAAKNTQPVNFNKTFPGSAETVVDTYEVAGPFTKKGWDFMRNSFKNPEKYFAGEQWVLGVQGSANIDRAGLAKQLADRYYSDFIKQWRNYLKGATVVRYANIHDAAKKLNVLSGNTSTLLAMFSLASNNTAVDEPDVAKQFQPVQAVVQPNADRFVGGGNQSYMNALLTLQSSVQKAADAPQVTQAVADSVLNDASTARVTTKQVAQTFRVDPDGHVDAMVQKLMEDPITIAPIIGKPDVSELNRKGKDLCAQYRRLSAKYPFNPSPSAPAASIAEVNSIFAKPDGAMWKFYQESLQKMLPKQGDRYVAASTPGVTLTPAFVSFFNNAAAVSDMFYAGGTPDPHVNYALKPLPAEGVKGIGLKLDGQSLSFTGGDAAPKQFTWQGAGAHSATATVNLGGPDLTWSGNDGLWAVWQFFAEAETWQPAGSAYNLEWVVRTGGKPLTLPSGKALTVKFQLDMGGGPPVFQKGYLSRMVCIADVAR